ncbi:MAG: helix-turn-helix transcriptional regulator [Anaerobacillus sp.]|uniref:helix-turn-helix transcriptional regulator n=1 Tax=Anaerobacillus sp. TaxID=1872506 RepID=UPI003918A8EE
MLRNRLKELRARHGFSQTELAKHVGVTRQTIGFIEKGEFSPSIVLSLRLAKHLHIRVDELFWLEGEDFDEQK